MVRVRSLVIRRVGPMLISSRAGVNYRIVRRIEEEGFSYVSLARSEDGAAYALVRWSPHACCS